MGQKNKNLDEQIEEKKKIEEEQRIVRVRLEEEFKNIGGSDDIFGVSNEDLQKKISALKTEIEERERAEKEEKQRIMEEVKNECIGSEARLELLKEQEKKLKDKGIQLDNKAKQIEKQLASINSKDYISPDLKITPAEDRSKSIKDKNSEEYKKAREKYMDTSFRNALIARFYTDGDRNKALDTQVKVYNDIVANSREITKIVNEQTELINFITDNCLW